MDKAVEVECENSLKALKAEQERANFFVEENIKLSNKIEELEDIIVNLSRPIDSAEVAVGYLKSNGALKDITE
jgi:formate dehydrogenase assembly factor FdhD